MSKDSEQVKVREFAGDFKSEEMKCAVCGIATLDRFLSNVSQISLSCFIKKRVKEPKR